MIPLFPIFKTFSLSDKKDLESVTTKFIPYSDYNFVSMWTYNIEGDFEISKLYENIVVCFRDYITNEKFLSFFGNASINSTCMTLLDYAKEHTLLEKLQLIPDFAINSTDSEKFLIEEDPDNRDYIYRVEDWATLPGHAFAEKRHKVTQFKTLYKNYHVKILDLTHPITKKEVLDLFDIWAENKTLDTEHEKIAVKRLLADAQHFSLFSLGIYIDTQLIGFTISELVQEKYAVLHYTKANPLYLGIFECIYTTFAQMILEKGYEFINREQDLGIVNLRNAKQSWHPIMYLKKYTISYKNATEK